MFCFSIECTTSYSAVLCVYIKIMLYEGAGKANFVILTLLPVFSQTFSAHSN